MTWMCTYIAIEVALVALEELALADQLLHALEPELVPRVRLLHYARQNFTVL